MVNHTAYRCDVCNAILRIKWSDTNGIGYCRKCACPHLIFVYDEDSADYLLSAALSPEGIILAANAWKFKGLSLFANLYNRGMLDKLRQKLSLRSPEERQMVKEGIHITKLIKYQGWFK